LVASACIDYPQSFPNYTHIFSHEFQETWHPSTSTIGTLSKVEEVKEYVIQDIEISLGKSLYINAILETD
jgi:hypothetical protein